MDTHLIYEIIGYVASVLIAVSLMMSAIIKLRVINLIGAAAFCLYGILIGAVPVAAMNGFIVLINIYYLSKILGDKEFFKLLRVGGNSEYLQEFISFYEEDIRNYQPGFSWIPEPDDIAVFVLRNMVPAGLLIARPDATGEHKVVLDYVIPNYRDFKIGKYLFEDRQDYFRGLGVTRLVATGGTEAHRDYLKKAGFRPEKNRSDRYEWRLR